MHRWASLRNASWLLTRFFAQMGVIPYLITGQEGQYVRNPALPPCVLSPDAIFL
jgi:hypothetical protein